jgi:hypothetical protein
VVEEVALATVSKPLDRCRWLRRALCARLETPAAAPLVEEVVLATVSKPWGRAGG